MKRTTSPREAKDLPLFKHESFVRYFLEKSLPSQSVENVGNYQIMLGRSDGPLAENPPLEVDDMPQPPGLCDICAHKDECPMSDLLKHIKDKGAQLLVYKCNSFQIQTPEEV